MEGTLSAGVHFAPSDPSLPIELFLKLIENQATTEGSGLSKKDLINLALSSMDTSAFDDTKPLSELQDLNEWAHFKSEMVHTFEEKKRLKARWNS